MKVLLVSLNNYEVNRELLYLPLGPYYLRGALMQHDLLRQHMSCAIKIYNSSVSTRDLVKSIIAEGSQIVGFSCWCWNILQILEVSHILKAIDPDIKIILGGPQVSPIAEGYSVLQSNQAIDIVVHGEGEVAFTRLMESLLTGRPSLRDIEGISYREGMDIRRANSAAPLVALDHVLLDIPPDEMRGFDLPNTVFLLETQRGCPFKCGFCYYNKGCSKVRFFSLGQVKDSIKFLLDNGAKRLYLADPTFNVNLRRAKDILRFIIDQRKDIILNTEIKAELMDEEFATLLLRAGTKFLDVGLQSINPRALQVMGRKLNQERFEKGVEILKQAGIEFQIQLICGLPGDDYGYYCKSLNYALDLVDRDWGVIEVFRLELIPGSEFSEKASDLGIVHEKSPPYYVVQTNTFALDDITKAEELTKTVKAIYDSPLLRVIVSDTLNQEPTEVALNLSSWLRDNAGLTVEEWTHEGSFKRTRCFVGFALSGSGRRGFDNILLAIKVYMILLRGIYRRLVKRAFHLAFL